MVLLKSYHDVKQFWESNFSYKTFEEDELKDWLHSQIDYAYGSGVLMISRDYED